MFIEKISKEIKEKYIKNYIDKINLENYPFTPLSKMHLEEETYKIVKLDKSDFKFAKEEGYDKFFENLEKENIYIRFYETSSVEMFYTDFYYYVFIFIFGDNDVKIIKDYIGSNLSYKEYCPLIKKDIKNNVYNLKLDNNEINKDYVTTFMAENVENIEEYIEYIKNIYKIKKDNCIKEVAKEEQNILNKMMEYTE